MPYIVVRPVDRAALVSLATARWDALELARPDLEPAVALQRRLITLVIDTASAVDGGRLPRLSLPARYLAAKLARGVPALAGEPIPLPVPMLAQSLSHLCDALEQGGAGEAAAHIRTSIASGAMDAGSLLTASLARNQDAIRQGAIHRGLAADLVWLVAELAVSPVAHALQRALFANVPPGLLHDALAGWRNGYCPACGSWPALAEVAGGHRVLRCSFCAAAWELDSYSCIYCGESGEAFVTAAPEDAGGELLRTDRRVEVCGACAGYLKTIDLAALSPFPLLAIADLETMDLDAAAMERGYGRPPLPEAIRGKPATQSG